MTGFSGSVTDHWRPDIAADTAGHNIAPAAATPIRLIGCCATCWSQDDEQLWLLCRLDLPINPMPSTATLLLVVELPFVCFACAQSCHLRFQNSGRPTNEAQDFSISCELRQHM